MAGKKTVAVMRGKMVDELREKLDQAITSKDEALANFEACRVALEEARENLDASLFEVNTTAGMLESLGHQP